MGSAPKRSELVWCFIGSNIVALGAGTPYLYSFYAPQLLERCQLPVSKLSTLSLALSFGSSLLGFVAGMVIDRNVMASCLVGTICTFFAYAILDYCYIRESSNVPLICLGLVLVGFGSVSGFYAAVKCCTTNFPHHRGTAGAFPVALYALSGMMFSFLCTRLFGDDIDKVFKFLTLACSAMIFMGCLTLKILVHPPKKKSKRKKTSTISQESRTSSQGLEAAQPIDINPGRENSEGSFSFGSRQNSASSNSNLSLASSFQSLWSTKRSSSFLWSKELTGSLAFWGWGRVRQDDANQTPPAVTLGTLTHKKGRPSYSSMCLSPQAQRRESYPNKSRQDSFIREGLGTTLNQSNSFENPFENSEATQEVFEDREYYFWRDNHVIQTIRKPRFIAYFLVLAILQGIGQMYIYSVGFIVQTQIASSPQDGHPLNAEKIQSIQVSIISIMSFVGRLLSGPVSDLLIKKLKAQRIWNIVIAAVMMTWASGQMLDSSSTEVRLFMSSSPRNITNISFCSAIFGCAFGILFGTFPAVIADSFGTSGFSTIWGLTTSGGLITVKIFCAILGSNLVKNTKPHRLYCDDGSQCYSHTFHVTMACALMAMFITLGIIGLTHFHKISQDRPYDNCHRAEFHIAVDNDGEDEDESPTVNQNTET